MKSVIKEGFKKFTDFVDDVLMNEIYQYDFKKNNSKLLKYIERLGVNVDEGYDHFLIETIYEILANLLSCENRVEIMNEVADIDMRYFYPMFLNLDGERVAFYYGDINCSNDSDYGVSLPFVEYSSCEFLDSVFNLFGVDTIVSCIDPSDVQRKYIDFLNNKSIKGKIVFFYDFLKDKLLDSDYKYLCKCMDDLQKHIDMLNSPEGIKYIAHKQESSMKVELALNTLFLLMDDGINDKNYNYFSNYIDNLDISKDSNLSWFTSILSSQWAYVHLRYLPYLDNTSIVSGYLKSIEQLLLNLIDEDCKKNNYRAIYNNKVVNVENSNKFMLGDLIDYISESERFITNKEFKEEVLSLLYPWKNKSRNGYFHKDILTSKEKIESIRKNTLLITYILIVYFESGKEICEKIDAEHFVF